MSDNDTDTSCEEEQIVPDWEVREEWLKSILKQYLKEGEVDIVELNVHPECKLNKSTLSSITRVRVKCITDFVYDDSGTGGTGGLVDFTRYIFDLFIKRLPQDPLSRFFVTENQFDLREIKFYTTVKPDLKEFNKRQLATSGEKILLPVPECYHTYYSPAGGTDDSPVPPESMLVLEDLTEPNFKKVEFSEGLTLDEAKSAMCAIACIHAHSLSMEFVDKLSLPERYPFLFQTIKATDSYQQLVERSLPLLTDFLKNIPELEVVLKTLLILRPRTKDIISTLLAPESPLASITHTDFWSNNLLFNIQDKQPEVPCYILDWQMVTYSRSTNDLALLLVSSVPTEIRREHTETLLNTYWSKLTWTCSQLGLNISKDLGYTREDLDKDYRKSQLLALLLCIGSVNIALGNPRTEQRLIDVLHDLYNDGILTDEAIIATNETDS